MSDVNTLNLRLNRIKRSAVSDVNTLNLRLNRKMVHEEKVFHFTAFLQNTEPITLTELSLTAF